MYAIKFGKCFSKFMIPIALLEKFGRSTFISSVEVHNMIADSSKPNKLRNVRIEKHDEERHHPKQCYVVLYINPANHAPGVKSGPTLGVISSHILTIGKTQKRIFSQKP